MSDTRHKAGEYVYGTDGREGHWLTGESIVRCHNCKYAHEDKRCTSIGWVSVLTCDSEQWSTSGLMPSHEVKPEGFCSWGEEKTNEQET
jgi:hypothetical protein